MFPLLANPGWRHRNTWTPASLSGLAAWFTAGPSWCFTDAGGTVPCGDGDPVRVWKDRSGNARDLSQATSGNRPVLRSVSGRWWVQFDGVDDGLELSGFAPGSAATIAIAHNTTGDGSFLGVEGGAVFQCRIGQSAANELSTYDGGNNPQSDALSTARGSNTASGYVLSGTTVSFYENGTARGSGTANWSSFTANRVGRSGIPGVLQITGYLGEIVLATATASAGDLTSLFGYLRSAWGTP